MKLREQIIKSLLAAGAVSLFLATGHEAKAAYSITSLGSAVTENFTSYAGSAAPNANWTVAPGLYRGADTGSCNQGGVRSYGTSAGDSDRALGFLGNGSTQSYTATASFTNNTGSTLTELVIAYTGEQYLSQVSAPSNITVSYSINGGAFTALSSLTFNAPSTAGAGVVNGNNPSFSAAKSQTIGSLSIANGVSISIQWTYTGATGGSRQGLGIDNISVTGNGVPAGPSNSRLWVGSTPPTASGQTTSTTQDFGRVMQSSAQSASVALSKDGSNPTTATVVASGNATTTTSGTINLGATGTSVNVGVSTSTTGTKSGAVTIDNQATSSAGPSQGSDNGNATVNVTATVLANRNITVTGSGSSSGNAINLGKVLVGANTGTATVTLSGGAQDDNNATRVVVGGSTSNAGITATAASGTFNGANQTNNVAITGIFGSSGAVSGSANVAGVLSNGEAVGVGATVDTEVGVNYTADVYEAALLDTNNGSVTDITFDGSAQASAQNAFADGAQRASAEITAKSITNGWSVTGMTVGTVLEAGGDAAVGTVSFDSTGKLNGTHVGTLLVTFEHQDQTIAGTSVNDIGTKTWDYSYTIADVVASSGSAAINANGSYAGYNLTNNSGKATEVAILAGTASADKELTLSFESITPGSFGAGNDLFRISDIASLTGTDTDQIVLQLTYDPLDLGSFDEADLRLMWFNGTDWVVAIAGNTGGVPNFFLGGYAGQGLGSFGLDTTNHTVWAVINHNSDFAVVISPVPEPSTIALLAGGLGLVGWSARRRLRKK